VADLSRSVVSTHLYQSIGGSVVVTMVVDVLYDRLTADPQLAPWFDGVDLRRLKSHQRAFLTIALGGPDDFVGRGLAEAHAGLAITGSAFDRLLDHLVAALTDLGLPDDGIGVIAARITALRDQVVDATLESPTS
jgi:hemoglobin